MKLFYIAAAFFVAEGLSLSSLNAGDAKSDDNPYSSIAKRNVFGLVPITTVPPSQGPDISILPLIVPNGIITISGVREVLYKVLGSGKPTQRHDVNAYIVREGQEIDGIKVIKIDFDAEAVTFDNHGATQKILLPIVVNRAAFSWLTKIH